MPKMRSVVVCSSTTRTSLLVPQDPTSGATSMGPRVVTNRVSCRWSRQVSRVALTSTRRCAATRQSLMSGNVVFWSVLSTRNLNHLSSLSFQLKTSTNERRASLTCVRCRSSSSSSQAAASAHPRQTLITDYSSKSVSTASPHKRALLGRTS